jgi:hypothetical protein
LDHSADSVNLPIINQSPSFDAASWNSSTNIVLSSILSHIYQHLGNQSKISSLSYKLLYIKDFKNKNVTCAWLNKIRCNLNDCGMSYIWNMQNCISDKWLKLIVKNNLVDQFKQTWTSMIENSSKGDNYKLFKHDLKFEDYLDVLDDKDKFLLVKFRTSNHRLPIEVGRWRNIKREIGFVTYATEET